MKKSVNWPRSVVPTMLIEGSTYAGIELLGSKPITSAVFENIEIKDSGTNGIYLSSNISGDATFSSIKITGSGKDTFLNYSPKLLFKLNIGGQNEGWQIP
jgi:hypothetical protein